MNATAPKTIRGLIGLTLLALAALAACGGGEETKPADTEAPAEQPAPAPEPTPAPAPEPAPAPAADAGAAPVAATFACISGNAEAGKAKYAQLCASCHGATGAGDGPASVGLNPKPAKHNDGNYMNTLSNEHLTKIITGGGTAVGKSPMMAPWGSVLGEQGVQDAVAFVRTLADPPYQCP